MVNSLDGTKKKGDAVIVKRSELLKALHTVSPGLTDKPLFDQSDCFCFTEGNVVTFNAHVSCRGPSGLDPDFTGAVAAKKFTDVLTKLSGEDLEVYPENGRLYVIDGKNKFWFVMEKDVLLPVDAVDVPKKWKSLPADFSEAIDVVRRCVGKDELQFVMTCVHVHPDFVEACDFMQICRWKTQTSVKSPFLVQGKWVKNLTSFGAEKFGESERWVHFKNAAGFVMSLLRYVDDYRDMTPYLAVEGERTVLPKSLVEAVGLAQTFSRENADDDNVFIYLKPGHLVLRAESVTGGCRMPKKVSYQGRPMSFYVSPEVLGNLAKKYDECVVTETRIKVTGEKLEYVLCLLEPEA